MLDPLWNNGETPGRLPPWVRGRATGLDAGHALKMRLRQGELATVCEEARCPNLGECFGRGVATFMILGDVCTRRCAFCAVADGAPGPVDGAEPRRLARAARMMELSHVVITSVDRDDLPDGGAEQFVRCIREVRRELPGARIEVLTPDFRHCPEGVDAIADERPEVFNHNLETVARLYPEVRPGADYEGSLALLARIKGRQPGVLTKSGLMAGLGETDGELLSAFADLRRAGCDMLTVGQYLRPSRQHRRVHRFVPPAGFSRLGRQARHLGFKRVAAGPLVRSSYHADGQAAAVRGHS